jgi:uncharacterized protein DUF5681
MVKRVRLNKSKVERSHDVGYRKPPKQTQFKSGQSGNPKGRPKGSRNFSTDVLSTLRSPVKVNKGGRARNISTQLATLLVLRDKALRGDFKAADHLLDLASRYNAGQQSPAVCELDTDDRAILTAYGRDLLTEGLSMDRTDVANVDKGQEQ